MTPEKLVQEKMTQEKMRQEKMTQEKKAQEKLAGEKCHSKIMTAKKKRHIFLVAFFSEYRLR